MMQKTDFVHKICLVSYFVLMVTYYVTLDVLLKSFLSQHFLMNALGEVFFIYASLMNELEQELKRCAP